MFPPKPKKKGLDVMIAVGKPKGDDLGAPGPLDGPGKKPTKPPMDDHEAGETPEYEAKEEQGADIISDVTAPLIELGFPEDQAKETAAKMFAALAKCLSGGESEGSESAEPSDEEAEMGGQG